MPGALDGFRVIDFSQVIAGPLATRVLADQGADVIKVEPPAGDILRHMGGVAGLSPTFATVNRSKRSLVLDLKKSGGVEALMRLVASADVFVQNSRPGTMERIGIGAKQLRERNPRLVYVSISGFGETGPYAHKRVYDPIVQGMSGLCEIQGAGTGPARPRARDRARQGHRADRRAEHHRRAARARAHGRRPAPAPVDARRGDRVRVARGHGLSHVHRRGAADQAGAAARPRVPDARWTHDRVDGRAPRVPGLLPRGRQAGVAGGPALLDHRGSGRERHARGSS